MRIVWQGGARQGLPEPLTCPVDGQVYEVAEDIGTSLVAQGKARSVEVAADTVRAKIRAAKEE